MALASDEWATGTIDDAESIMSAIVKAGGVVLRVGDVLAVPGGGYMQTIVYQERTP